MTSTMTSSKATAFGFVAIVLWSTLVASMRGISEHFGVIGGAALSHTLAAILLFFTQGGFKGMNLRLIPKKYLLLGGIFFVAYELCLPLAVGYADNSRQAVEIGMINYLWPVLTVIFAIVFLGGKATWLIVPGFIISLTGVILVIAPDEGFSLKQILVNIQTNPISYILALAAAFLWAGFCTITVKFAQGKNATAFFFALASLVFWIYYLFSDESTGFHFSLESVFYLILGVMALGIGYFFWNIGIAQGNVMILAGASYFIPVLSAFAAVLLLGASLSLLFWQGAAMVCAGSIICWLATRNKS